MLVYVAKPGDTVYSIILKHGIPMSQFALDNGPETSSHLAVRQALVVQPPTQTHTVQPGEALASIATAYQFPPRQLYRNNPILDGIPELYPGQILMFAYDSTPEAALFVNGRAYPFIDPVLLQSVVPYLIYLTPFIYGFTPDGTLAELDNEASPVAVRQGGATPLMHLPALTERGGFSSELAHLALIRSTIQDTLVDNLEATLVRKGCRRLDVDFGCVYAEGVGVYTAFLGHLAEWLNPLGYLVIAASAPEIAVDQLRALYKGRDLAAIGVAANQVLLMTYEWGYTCGPPMVIAPLPNMRQMVEYALMEIPASKVWLDVPLYGYDWPFPSVQGRTRAQSISPQEAVTRVVRYDVDIQYSEQVQAPWYRYTDGYGITHEAWFEGARSIQAKLALVLEHGLYGVDYRDLV